MVLGLVDGRIRIHTVEEDPWMLDDYWHLAMHDNSYGQITGVSFSFDRRSVRRSHRQMPVDKPELSSDGYYH